MLPNKNLKHVCCCQQYVLPKISIKVLLELHTSQAISREQWFPPHYLITHFAGIGCQQEPFSDVGFAAKHLSPLQGDSRFTEDEAQ